MTCEIKITLKNDAKNLTKKKIVDGSILADFIDPRIDALLDECQREFDDTVKKTVVTIRLIGDDE